MNNQHQQAHYTTIVPTVIILLVWMSCGMGFVQCNTAPEPTPYSEDPSLFSGNIIVEDFTTADYLDTTGAGCISDLIAYTPGTPPIGPGNVVTMPVELDINFYYFHSIRLSYDGLVNSIDFYYDSPCFANRFFHTIPNPISDEYILLGNTSVSNLSRLVMVFNLGTGTTLYQYELRRRATVMPSLNTFYGQPNPFNPYVGPIKFRFALYFDARVSLQVYSLTGELIKTVLDHEQRLGDSRDGIAYGDDWWDGQTENDTWAAPGTYTARLKIEPDDPDIEPLTLSTDISLIW
jgi:hypothetical protein